MPPYLPQGNEEQVFEAAYRRRLPLLLKGPTGCGKTRFVEHMAGGSAGRSSPSPAMTTSRPPIWSAASYRRRRNGLDRRPADARGARRRICYLDEIVEARKDTTVVIHPLTDDRRVLPIEKTRRADAGAARVLLVISYNPGYQTSSKI